MAMPASRITISFVCFSNSSSRRTSDRSRQVYDRTKIRFSDRLQPRRNVKNISQKLVEKTRCQFDK
ncbi:MAG: hypothetical protein ACI90V_010148 [Bacillariaceae sp.]|jgi:hypothetical protein